MLYPKLKANRIIHTFLRLSRILKVFFIAFRFNFLDYLQLPCTKKLRDFFYNYKKFY